MALLATNRFAGDGVTTSYGFSFVGKYIARSHVKVYQEDNATKVRTYVSITDGNFLNDTTLQGLPATPVGSTLVIYRDTPKPPLVDFVNGSRFTEYNLDLVARQGLFVAMEALDAGDSDARQQLLDAITAVAGLVNDAEAAVSDATAAALAAATSATRASDSAIAAAASASNAAASATAAAASAAQAQGDAIQGRMCCRVVVVNAVSRIVRLERCGGTSMTIGGAVRTIPAGGVDITLPVGPTPLHIYAGWNGSTITLSADAVAPTWSATYGRWTKAASTDTVVAFVLPTGLTTPERFLRNYYNGPGAYAFTAALLADYTANWDGSERQLLSLPFLILPGDNLEFSAHAGVMSTPPARVGDLIVKLDGGVVARARNSHQGAPYVWQNYSCHAVAPMRPLTSVAAQQSLTLHYLPISTEGSIFTAHGDGITTRVSANITPYRFT